LTIRYSFPILNAKYSERRPRAASTLWGEAKQGLNPGIHGDLAAISMGGLARLLVTNGDPGKRLFDPVLRKRGFSRKQTGRRR